MSPALCPASCPAQRTCTNISLDACYLLFLGISVYLLHIILKHRELSSNAPYRKNNGRLETEQMIISSLHKYELVYILWKGESETMRSDAYARVRT